MNKKKLNDLLQRSVAKFETLGKPGLVLPWKEDEHGSWGRLLEGGERVVAIVDRYGPELDPDERYFYVVGDGPKEESPDEFFDSADAAREAADARLREMGYTF